MQVKAFVIGLICFMGLFANATETAQTCKAVHWPYSPDLRGVTVEALNLIPRPHLYSYLYSEISSEPVKRVPGLAEKLFFYLKNTEVNEDRYQMIQALEYAADLGTAKPRIIPLKEICNLEEKGLREPSSTAKAKKAKTPAKAKKASSKAKH
jgi:hypothetical protein